MTRKSNLIDLELYIYLRCKSSKIYRNLEALFFPQTAGIAVCYIPANYFKDCP